jgi:hypothetical protein
MNAARLIVKQPTGWFAAGREVAQALGLLSDGAFKLYIHLCLEADRHTGRVQIEPAEWARILRKNAATMEADFAELHRQGICQRHHDRVEICDRFWPYQKQGPQPSALRRRSSCSRCGKLFWDRPACTPHSPRQMKSWHGI